VVGAGFFAFLRSRGVGNPPSVCAPASITADIPFGAVFEDLAMPAPGRGWAVGYTYDGVATDTPLLLEYRDCHWAPVSDPLPGSRLNNISMVSPDEGWAAGESGSSGDPIVALHYTGGHWQPVALPNAVQTPGGNYSNLVMIRMLSADEGW